MRAQCKDSPRGMLDYDDGESSDAVYIYNATNRQVGCYTLQSGFQPSWSLPCFLLETMSLWILFMSQHLHLHPHSRIIVNQ